MHHLTLPLHKMEQSGAAYINQEEWVVIMEIYVEYYKVIRANSAVTANKARDKCWKQALLAK